MRSLLKIILPVFVAMCLLWLSQTTVKADGEYTITDIVQYGDPGLFGHGPEWFLRIVNTGGTTLTLNSVVISWDGGGSINALLYEGGASYYYAFNNWPHQSPYIFDFGYSLVGDLPPGQSKGLYIRFTSDTTNQSNLVFNGTLLIPGSIVIFNPGGGYTVTTPTPTITPTPTPTITPTPTPTVYGEATATVTPTPTGTPRPAVESTVQAAMSAAEGAIPGSLNIDNVQPYDWRTSGSSFNFPNLFDGAIAPYFGLIFSYMLALVDIFNTNNVVVIIFILTLSITILMIVIKLVSGGALSGWQDTGIKDAIDNPYRAINKKR